MENVSTNHIAEPIPERLRDPVWRAEDTGDPAALAALSSEDIEIVVAYLEGLRANIAQILNALAATRRS